MVLFVLLHGVFKGGEDCAQWDQCEGLWNPGCLPQTLILNPVLSITEIRDSEIHVNIPGTKGSRTVREVMVRRIED